MLGQTDLKLNEPRHDKSNKMICAPSENSLAWAYAQSDLISPVTSLIIRLKKTNFAKTEQTGDSNIP